MAAIAWADVVAEASALAAVDPAVQMVVLQHVNNELRVADLGGENSAKARMARIYFAAHHGAVSLRAGKSVSGTSGDVVSETIGVDAISLRYSEAKVAANSTAEILATTTWGAQYLAMVRSSPARLPFAL